jgi:folate-binding protein YgfZ
MLNYCKIAQDFLKFEGNERLDLVNRLSTNKVDTLGKFKGIKTVLTTDKGRFVDLLTLYNFGDFVFAACTKRNSDSVIAHLNKYTIMDDFQVTDLSGTHETILFYGGDEEKFTKDLFNIDISGFANNDFQIYAEDDRHALIAKNDDSFGGVFFIHTISDTEFYYKKIFDASVIEKFGLNEISSNGYEVKRIEKGIPKFGREMTDETNPLECGMEKYVSFTKGCYIGQEVIARLDTYDKISKHLVGLKLSAPLVNEFKAGELKINTDNKECGFVTSFVISEQNENSGLGFVKTAFLDFNKEYEIKLEEKKINCNLIKINQLELK